MKITKNNTEKWIMSQLTNEFAVEIVHKNSHSSYLHVEHLESVESVTVRVSDHRQKNGGGFNNGTGEQYGDSDYCVTITDDNAFMFIDVDCCVIGSDVFINLNDEAVNDITAAFALSRMIDEIKSELLSRQKQKK